MLTRTTTTGNFRVPRPQRGCVWTHSEGIQGAWQREERTSVRQENNYQHFKCSCDPRILSFELYYVVFLAGILLHLYPSRLDSPHEAPGRPSTYLGISLHMLARTLLG